MRLNKYISHNTKYSRREADKLIEEGRVKINRQVVKEHGVTVKKGDRVYVNDRLVKPQTKFTVIVYHKPKGELVTKKDDRGRKTVYDSLPKKFSHFIPIGRLDFASEGLLLLTDSPKVASSIMESSLERVYYLKIRGSVTPEMEKAMQEGLTLKDATKGAHEKTKEKSMTFAPFVAYKIIKNSPTFSKLKVVISEGKNRELRRFFAHFDREVVDLKRVSFGGVDLGVLKKGKTRYLTKKEYEDLKEFLKELEKEKKDGKSKSSSKT